MPEIRISYRRVWQVKQYESEEILLGITEMVHLEGAGDKNPMATEATAQARAERLAAIEATYYRQLAAMGDALIEERIQMAPVAPTPAAPAQPRRTVQPPDLEVDGL